MTKQDKTDYKAQVKSFLSDWVGVAKKKWWLYLVELAVVATILVADLLSKKYAWSFLDQNGVKENILNLFNLVKVKNEGAGFGIFQGKTVALTVITFIVVIVMLIYLFFALKESEWLRISLVFIVGGGIGNIVDRIKFGYVRDFIQFSFWDDFPVFNVADSFVTVGAFMLVIVLIVMLVQEGKKNQKEFEEQQKGKTPQEQIDPLDAPINLNPMMKSENDYTFEVSENKDEKPKNPDGNAVNSNDETTKTALKDDDKAAQTADGNDYKAAQNDGESDEQSVTKQDE